MNDAELEAEAYASLRLLNDRMVAQYVQNKLHRRELFV